MAIKKLLLLGVLLLVISTLGWADELVVIAHLDSGINQLNRAELVNLYLGRSKKLASGITALPVDLSAGSPQKKMFYEQLVNKPLPEIQAYWARLLFTGLSTPPHQADNVNEALELVSHNQGAIAYIDRRQVKPSVKIVFKFNP